MSCSSLSASIKQSNYGRVFESGIHPTVLISIKSEDLSDYAKSIPLLKPLLIGAPTSSSQSTEFPVLLLLHGYLLCNLFYSQLIQHIASHGFIVIAPQLYTVAGSDSSDEIMATAAIINWLSKGLTDVLPSNVRPNLEKLAVSGHSRGGKVAFALALSKVAKSPQRISALIGIDPVDGMDIGKQTPPPVLNYISQSFHLDGLPVLVLGSGLGSHKKNPWFPACAPKGVNHADFYDECQSPAWYFLVKDYGHMDMLDEDTKGIRGKATYCLCKNGNSREPMRRFTGGVIVAFLNAYFHGDFKDLLLIRDGHESVPVEFEKFNCRT